jgi:DNA modification methylase
MTAAPTTPELASRPTRQALAPAYGSASSVVLWHGDCEDVLPQVGHVDVIITDPPYGVEFRGAHWDKEVPRIATELPAMFGRVAIIMGTTAAYQFPLPKWVACWARPASSSRSKIGGFSHWSPILIYGDCKMAVDYKSWHAIANAYKDGSWGAEHPSPKPEPLMEWLVSELSKEGETVCDPFMGSGTTGVAAVRAKRNFVGIEKDARHYKTALERISNELKQGVML